jgi:hypothetical protein
VTIDNIRVAAANVGSTHLKDPLAMLKHLRCLEPRSCEAAGVGIRILQLGGMILRKQSLLLVAALAIPALLLASSPKMELSWKNPDYKGAGVFKNILVLALNGKVENRAEFEDELTAAITRPGVQATQSYVFLPRPESTPIDIKDLKEVIQEQNFDAIVVARLTKAEIKTTYVPGEVYTPLPVYGNFAAFYGFVTPEIYTPGYLEKEKIARVETNFYATAKPNGELVWTGTTNAFDANSAMKAIKDLVKITIKELEKNAVLPPKT